MLTEIPRERPSTPLLDTVNTPKQLRLLPKSELTELASQLRAYLLYSVGQTGGHFGGGLGVVELTIALHYLFDTPNDHLVWDVGHQSYPHKILTDRREAMLSIRQLHGIHPFPDRSESVFDDFGTGHSSTSISAALGMAIADKLNGRKKQSIAIIGDGALTAGLAFEALNHAAHTNANLIVILNDNDMSISANEGGLASYLAQKLKIEGADKTNTSLFEALAFNYVGPIDGHNFDELFTSLNAIKDATGPQFLHIMTKKGKGFLPAESDPVGYHAITKIEPINKQSNGEQSASSAKQTFANIFGQWMLYQANKDDKVVAITPAMKEGSDLIAFANQYPDRFFDVAIAEQHALTFAAGLACEGIKPVVAIYSTFFQRAYDQYIHDIAIQQLNVTIAIDRAGLVGQDGATHAGCYDIAALRCIPNTIIMTPSDEQELWLALNTAHQHKGPVAVRYPRGSGSKNKIIMTADTFAIGKAELLRETSSSINGYKIALLNFGPFIDSARIVSEKFDLTLVDMRFVKPLDQHLLDTLASTHTHFITLEDHAISGGAGSAVSQYLAHYPISFTHLGIPDLMIPHGSREEQLAICALDISGISKSVEALIKTLG